MRKLTTLALLAALATPAVADVTFNDFTNTAGLSLVGTATTSSGTLVIAPGNFGSIGGAWFGTKQEVGDGFVSNFVVSLPPFGGREGLAFVIQNGSTGELGGGGCELGYDGIANSLAIEFDARASVTCGGSTVDEPGGIHVSVHSRGSAPNSAGQDASLGSARVTSDFGNGTLHFLRVEYLPGTLKVYVDQFATPVVQVAVDLEQELSLDAGTAYTGFTSSSGSSPSDTLIYAWTLSETGPGSSNNISPLAPNITGPPLDGLVVNPQDPHMSADGFFDADGDDHLCTDWEIWTLTPLQKVWEAQCKDAVQLGAIQLADGTFVNSQAGNTALEPSTLYGLRVRFRDDSGDGLTEYGPFAERIFESGAAGQIFPLQLEDVADVPPASLLTAQGDQELFLPGGTTPATLSVESGLGDLLVRLTGDGTQNLIDNPAGLPALVAVRVVITAGDAGLVLPEFDLRVADAGCTIERLLLPALNLAPLEQAYYWISTSGESYVGGAGQVAPDFSTLARGASLPWDVKAPGFIVEEFATGFTLPVNIAFVPDPGNQPGDIFFYVTELYGTVKVVTRDGTVSDYATGLLNYAPSGAFPGSGEQGLAGILVDPTSGDVIVTRMRRDFGAGANYPQVVRLSSNDGGFTSATETVLLDMVGEPQGESHQISNLNLDASGKLIVHNGDGFFTPTAQDVNSYRGKILRMNLDGSAPTDNPFYNAGDGINARDYTWALGVRNPFGGDWRASDGRQYVVENGPSVDRFAHLTPGQNLGWNGTNASMMNAASYNWAPAHAPVNLVFIQPETFDGSGFPEWLQDQAFVTLSGPTYAFGQQQFGKFISRFRLDASGAVVEGPVPFIEYTGTGRATAVGLEAGPDGLYMTDLYAPDGPFPTTTGSNVLRIRYDGLADCNGNGVHDLCDIGNGLSLDVNGDGSPDECECSGTPFCSSTPNSTGLPALISSAGSCSVADNDFWLSAGPVPTQPGIFYYGPNQVNGGSGTPLYDGFRCVGGSTVRLAPQVAQGDRATVQIDLTSPVGSLLTPGTTWNFQYWYRDPAAGLTGASFSDGLTVTFQ